MARQDGQLTVYLWQDNKPVVVIATNCDPAEAGTVNRKLRDGSSTTVSCPQAIVLYNLLMGGVDNNDQLRGCNAIQTKSRKFYKYINWFIANLAITNSYILCREHTHLGTRGITAFRVQLAKELIGSYRSRKRPGRHSSTQSALPASFFEHFPVRGDEHVHRCSYCHKHRNLRRETVWYCNACHKFLCHNGREDDCFLQYHRMLR